MDFKKSSEKIREFTQELIAIPSFENERDIANKVLDKFDELDISGKIVGSDLEHPSLIALVKNKTNSIPKKVVLLEAALDTTPPGNINKWTNNPFNPFIKDNKLYGLGVADAKIAIALYTYLAQALSQDEEFEGQLFLAFDAQEQSGKFFGIKEIIPYLPKIDAGLLGYQSYNEIHIGARGWIRLNLTVFGKSWHTGSRRDFGINAIHKLIKALSTILELKISSTSPFFEYGSNISVSIVNGGEAINIVPDKAKASLDIRIIDNQSPSQIISKIQNALIEISKIDTKFDYKLDVMQAENAYLTNPDCDIVNLLKSTAERQTGQNIKLVTSGAGSVGNVLSQLGFPIINAYGVLSDNAHSTDEWIDITTIEPVFGTLYETIKTFCSQ